MKLTRFERARILGARALQISMGAPILVSFERIFDPISLAQAEFEKGMLPISVKRSEDGNN